MTTLDRYRIPNVNAPAYAGEVPPPDAFRLVPAHEVQRGDLLLLKRGVFVVAGVKTVRSGRERDFTLDPVEGGRRDHQWGIWKLTPMQIWRQT